MKNPGRRIGTAIAMGLTWVAAWSGAGFLVARVAGYESDLPLALLFAPFALVAGILCSGILMAIEGRRGLDRVSLSATSGWGAASGLLLAGIFPALRGAWGEYLVFGPSLALASAVAAAGSLAIARKAEGREVGGPGADATREPLGRGD